MLWKSLATPRTQLEVHFIQKTFTEDPPYLALSHRHAKVPLTSPPTHLNSPPMHSHDSLPSLSFTTRLLSKSLSVPLFTIPKSSIHFSTPFLYCGCRLESLDFSEAWFLYQMASSFQEHSHPHSLSTYLIYSDPHDYLKGSLFSSFLDISADTYCTVDNVLEEEEVVKKPSLEKHSVQVG